MRLETASMDEIHAIQDRKLPIAVRYVYENIQFYRRKFDDIGLVPEDIRGVDDLSRIPITTKQEMGDDLVANSPWGTYTAIDDDLWLRRGWQTFSTSGTTGQARVFRYSQLDRDLWAWLDARAIWAMGARPGRDTALLAFGYGPHVWLWGVHYALNLMGIGIVTAGGQDSRTRVRLIDQYRPTILACTPSYALYLANVMEEMGLDPAASSIRLLFCAGEPGYSIPGTRRRLEDVWQATLHDFYGCTEASPAPGGYTCSAVQDDRAVGPHLMEDVQIWETVDPVTLMPVPEGRSGLTVVTNLCSEASPQLRFLVGDFTTLTRSRCPCGRSHMQADGGFLGRADDMLNVRGVTVFPSAIEDAVRRVPEIGQEFQIVVSRDRGRDVLTVLVEPRPDVPPEYHPSIVEKVESEIVSRCDLRSVVEVVPYGTLPRTEFKAKRLRDMRAGLLT